MRSTLYLLQIKLRGIAGGAEQCVLEASNTISRPVLFPALRCLELPERPMSLPFHRYHDYHNRLG